MNVARRAVASEVRVLVGLMGEFYEESDYLLDRAGAARAFADLIADPRYGAVWLLEREARSAGYVVLTVGYSMEFGGRDAFVDDLFVRAPFRGLGLGRVALDALFAECRAREVLAVHLEVDRANEPAKALYHKFGFRDHDRQLMTRRLASAAEASS